MHSALADVAAFHDACDVPVVRNLRGTLRPTIPPEDRIALREKLIDEEVNKELLPALRSGDLTAIADALADSVYVIVGTALEYGIPLGKVWEIVQQTNMAKVDPATGKVIKRADGKVLKPDGWQAPEPEIAALIRAHQAA